MKFNFKGIKFKTWLYFFFFSLTMLILLGVLLIAFIKPYYRENRIKMIDTIVSTLENELLTNKVDQRSIDKADKLVNGNNICALIYNENGKRVYEADSLGKLCMLDDDIVVNDKTINIGENAADLIDILNNMNEFETYVMNFQLIWKKSSNLFMFVLVKGM